MSFEADALGYFGDPGGTRWGGRFMPEALVAALDELTAAWQEAMADAGFVGEFERVLRDYAGVPSRLYEATRLQGQSSPEDPARCGRAYRPGQKSQD